MLKLVAQIVLTQSDRGLRNMPPESVSEDRAKNLIGNQQKECRDKFRTGEGCDAIKKELKEAIKGKAGRGFAWGVNILLGIIIAFMITQTKWLVGMHNDQAANITTQSEKINTIEKDLLAKLNALDKQQGEIVSGIEVLTNFILPPSAPDDTANH